MASPLPSTPFPPPCVSPVLPPTIIPSSSRDAKWPSVTSATSSVTASIGNNHPTISMPSFSATNAGANSVSNSAFATSSGVTSKTKPILSPPNLGKVRSNSSPQAIGAKSTIYPPPSKKFNPLRLRFFPNSQPSILRAPLFKTRSLFPPTSPLSLSQHHPQMFPCSPTTNR